MVTSKLFNYIPYLLLVLLLSCNAHKEAESTFLFSEISTAESGIDFENRVINTDSFNIFTYRNFYNGGGVAIGDINNDGLSDVFFTANMGANKLYLNKGNFSFEDISIKAGITEDQKWSTGVVMVDVNSDGWLDIYVCNAGNPNGAGLENELYINQKDLTFVEESEKYGLNDNGYTTHAAFFDYDLDGDLDVYMLNNSFIPVNTLNYSNKRNLRSEDWPVADFLKGGGDKLYRNEGGRFHDVSEQAGILGSLIGFGLGVVISDLNNDQLLDIYVCNDFFERDYLYINMGDGTFKESLEEQINHLSHSAMGADIADINNDGRKDIFVTDMLPRDEFRYKTNASFDNIDVRRFKEKQGFYNQFMHNTLQLNDGNGRFKEISNYSGIAASDWSWGALMFDGDNDGLQDILVCNGIYNDVIDLDFIDFFANDVIQKMALEGGKEEIQKIIDKMPSTPLSNLMFRNMGDLKFQDVASKWGLDKATFSNGAAYGDLDNDGDLDLIINNVNQSALVYKNNGNGNHFIGFELVFEGENIKAIGSEIQIFRKGEIIIRELIPSRGFQSSVDYKMTIGLGNTAEYDSIRIVWPNKASSVIDYLDVDQYHKIEYEKLMNQKVLNQDNDLNTLMVEVSNIFEIHEEDDYVDFYYERNIPVQLSKEGPAVAVGDYDNDGYDDIFIGGSYATSAHLYKGSKDGFTEVHSEFFERFAAFEDVCAIFVDVDNDGDLDLIVGSGGNNIEYDGRAFRDRLYTNEGDYFDLDFNALPPNAYNTSVIAPYDFNKDGFEDLFIGSRSIPGGYGLSPGSFVYMNNGKGRFLDVTQQIIPELAFAGMVTDAIWIDVTDNEGKELVLVGEWMAPKVLGFNGSTFDILENGLEGYSGFWQSVLSDDIDKDGDEDLILGNMGENFSISADSLNPMVLWINDFDGNGSVEKIITKTIDGKSYPIIPKRELVEQIPGLKKENMLHSEYANKSILDLFGEDQLKSSNLKQVNYLKSSLAINDGKGHFAIKPLDYLAQLSCINAIQKYDVNHDGYQDLIIGGNNHYFLPQFSMVDASHGQVLINDKKGGYVVTPDSKSGLNLDGVVRSIQKVKLAEKDYFLVGINNQKPQLYKIKETPVQ